MTTDSSVDGNPQASVTLQHTDTLTRSAVDTGRMLRFMDLKIARETNARRRSNLQTVRDHMYYETILDPDGVMTTLSPEANYKLWVDGVDKGPKGFEGIRHWYIDQNIRRNKTFVIEYALERVVVDDDTVVTEGQMNVVVDGTYANNIFSRDCQPDDIFLQSYRQVVFWSLDKESKLLGEDFYSSGMAEDRAWRQLCSDEIPADWYRLVELSRNI